MSADKSTYSVEDIKLWIDNLPKANIEKTTALVIGYINELLKQQEEPAILFSKLELFQEITRFLNKELREFYIGESIISKQKQPYMIELAQKIEIQYATAYVFALQQLDKASEPVSQIDHAGIVYRAILHLINVLVVSYEVYQQPPSNLWSKFHKLYLHAEKHHIETTAVATEQGSNILTAYKHALLLSTVDPYHLRPRETSDLSQALSSWANLAELNTENTADDLFLLQLDKNEPPVYQSIAVIRSQRFYIRGINTAPLVEYLTKLLKQHEGNDTAPQYATPFKESMLQYLIEVWSKPYSRKFPRVKYQGEFDLCIGLSATHYFLSGEYEKSPPTTNSTDEKSKPAVPKPDLSLQPISNEEDTEAQIIKTEKRLQDTLGYYDPWEDHSESEDESPLTHLRDSQDAQQFKTYRWSIVDNSPGGYCLSTTEEKPLRLQTEELVGLQTPSKDKSTQWIIGVVRWIERDDENTKIGIKLLSPSALAVAVQVQRNVPTDYLRAILLPELINMEQPATLLLPPLEFHTNEHAYVVSQNSEYEIEFTRVITENECFRQAEFDTLRIISDEEEELGANKDKDSSEGMDSVWDEL